MMRRSARRSHVSPLILLSARRSTLLALVMLAALLLQSLPRGTAAGATGLPVTRASRVTRAIAGSSPARAMSASAAPAASTSVSSTPPYTYPVGGAFVLGDQSVAAALSATSPSTVTWWGAQWSAANTLSGGAAPSSFKGFAQLSAIPTACGSAWTTRPGNSPPPPSGVPAYMAVIVASGITKSGNTISGDTAQVVIVKTNPGYQPDPGHPGTGTVIGVLCPATLALRLSAPASVSPGAVLSYVAHVRNTGRASATAGSLALTYPNGTAGSLSLPAIAPGDTITRTLPYTVPALAPKGASEADSAYQTRLAAVDGTTLPVTATLSWRDGQGLPVGTATAQAQSVERVPVLSITAPTLPASLTPGQTVPLSATVRNTGSGEARTVTVRFTNPDGSVTAPTTATLASGQTTTLQSSWVVPRLPATSTEGERAYEDRLAALNGAPQVVTAAASWRDTAADPYGSVSGRASSTESVPVVDLALAGPASAAPGSHITYTLTLTNTSGADAGAVNVTLAQMDQSLAVPLAGDTLAAGAARQVTVPFTVPLTQAPGAGIARARATWQDAGANAYGPSSAAVTTTIGAHPTLQMTLTGPRTATAGDTATYDVAVTNTATGADATASRLALTLLLPGGGLQTADGGDPLAPGASRVIPIQATLPATLTSGDALSAVHLTWQDSGQNTYGPLTGIVTTTMTALPTATPTNTPTNTAIPTDTPSSTPTPTDTPKAVYYTNGLNVFVGYADNLRANPNLPVPWRGAPNTTFIGDGGAYDSGAIRLDNTTDTTITVNDVSTYFPNHNQYNGQTIDLWGSFMVPPHQSTILAETNGSNFDTSDYGIPGVGCDNPAGADNNPPQITLTLGDGTKATLLDTGHILDTGGRDAVNCYGNESLQWRALGTVGATQAGGSLVLQAPGDSPVIGTPYTQVATLSDASNLPQPNVSVNFHVTSGPNAGATGSGTTDARGIATFTYTGSVAGTDTIVGSITNVSGATFDSAPITVTWLATAPTPRPTITPTNTPIPTDTPIASPTSAPGSSATPQSSSQIETPGWIGSPANGATVSGQVPISLTSGETLQQATVDYWPADNPNAVTTLPTNVSGMSAILLSGRHAGLAAPLRVSASPTALATLDTTTLADGSYVIRLRGADTTGATVTSEVYVTVVGDNKPGRVTFTQTDLTVPVAGLPIQIGRSYDSLNRTRVGDFGYGWSLSQFDAHLQVDPAMNVTLDLPNGKRSTFYFAPEGHILYETSGYRAGPGVYGSLTANGCGLFESGGSAGGYYCLFGDGPNGLYQPDTYVYTDPYGRVYTYGSDGTLRSVRDISGTTLTIGPDGIVSNAGDQVVPFMRDSQGRIRTITDLDGNVYRYTYNAAGDLAAVTLPGVSTPITYTYTADHLLQSETDARGNAGGLTAYYPDGRLQSVTDAVGNTTSYTYDVPARTTYVTNPDGGVITTTTDGAGNVISQIDPLGRTRTYTYDGQNNLLSATDPLGHATAYTYDANGNQTSATDPLNHTSYTTYNAYGGPLTLTDALGNLERASYDSKYRLSSMADTLGFMGGFTYDDHGDYASKIDGNGKSDSLSVDQFGNVVSETDPLSRTTMYTYDTLGRQLSATGPLSHMTHDSIDGMGHILAVTNPLSETTQYTYDGNGNQTSATDPLSHRTAYQYDAANRVRTITYPDGTTEAYTYDFRGNVLTHTDQANHITRYVYDQAGELTSVTTALGTSDESTTSYHYDGASRLDRKTDPMGRITRYDYDDDGRLWHIYAPLGHTTTYTYDADGHMRTVTDGDQHTTRYDYDTRGRLTTTTYADSTTMSQGYDGAGNVITETDQAGKTTAYTYNDVNQLLSVTDPLTDAVTYHYDGDGSMDRITDANNNQTRFTYDELDRVQTKIWPDGSYESYQYDAAGNQWFHRLADGHANTYSYDALNRLAGIHYFDGSQAVYTATATGREQIAADGGSITSYAYDAQDRLRSITGPANQSIAYTYYPDGQRQTLTTAAGTTTYGYDGAGDLQTVAGPTEGTVTYRYDQAGNRTNVALPNGITVAYGYDQLSRLTGVTQTKGSQLVAAYAYTLGPAGNRLQVSEGDGSSTRWTYDDAYHLTGEARYDSSGNLMSQVGYTYEPDGNRHTLTANGQTTIYTYNTLDQLTSAGATQYGYDGRGNVTSVTNGASSTQYSYDAADRLTAAALPDSTRTTYGYDANGNRVSQTVGANSTNYLWDPTSTYGDVALETDGSGHQQVSYVLGDNGPLAQTRNSATSYYLQDGQGSVRALANANGAITDQYRYDAFGSVQSHTGTTPNAYLYTGQQYDAATGLYDLRARYYDPGTGRFLNRDTAGFDQYSPTNLNRYRYASCNPVNHTDPSGHDDVVEYGELIREGEVADEEALAKITERENQCGVKFIVDAVTGALTGYFLIQQGTDFFNSYPNGLGIPLDQPLGPDGTPPSAPVPGPSGQYRLLTGDEYATAKDLKNAANNALHNAYNDEGYNLRGLDIHEPHPVKFGGCPNCNNNKFGLDKEVHKPFTRWWRKLQDCLERLTPISL